MYDFSDRINNVNGTATREILKLTAKPDMISFAGGLPASECLPFNDINKIASEILSGADSLKTLQYGVSEGMLDFRNELTLYIKEVGVEDVDPDNILVVSGGQQGLELMVKAFLNKGDTVLVEDPTYLAFLQIVKSYEGNTVGVKSNDDGLDLNDLEEKLKKYKPKLIYTVPTFSNPTGKTYKKENRIGIIALAEKYGAVIIEDDPYSKIRYSGEYQPAMKSYDKNGTVVYISSFSKILSPGLRVAFACGDKQIIRKMTLGKQNTDLQTSSLSQMIAFKYLQKGLLKDNIISSVPLYRSRKTAMINALKKYMPDEFTHTDPDGGLFIWGEFDKSINTAEAFPLAIEKKVAYVEGSVFFADGGHKNTLRLNYSSSNEEIIDKGIKSLGDLFKDIIAKNN